jgi:uncharacterized membrane protein
MDALTPFHPQLVHTPIALLMFSALFMLVGRLTDGGWWRRAAVAMLIIGFLGGVVALKSGEGAGDRAEDQGVPGHAVDAHEDMARVTLILAGGALVLLGVAARVKSAAGVLNTLALLLQIGAAVAVGVTGHRGGRLVYEYGANVRTLSHAAAGRSGEAAAPESSTVARPRGAGGTGEAAGKGGGDRD